MTMKTIDADAAATLRAELEALAEVLEERHGLKIQIGTIRYAPARAEVKLTIDVVSADGTNAAEREQFERHAERYGLAPSDFGRTFRLSDGHTYRLAGINPRRPKKPIIVTREDGRRMKAGAEMVRAALAISNDYEER